MTNRKLVYCAGGLVWRQNNGKREILLILSRNDQAWKLPKGHIDDDDETWEAAAQREVKEETGYDTAIIDFAGFTKYPVKDKVKVVLYWHMTPAGEPQFEECDEIECCDWFTVGHAVDRLTYLNDKKFLLQFAEENELRDE